MRLIIAERVKKDLQDIAGCGAKPGTWERGWDEAINAAIETIDDAPTVDAEPVRHGMWWRGAFCSQCGGRGEQEFRYCPNCGAKMDGGA